MEHIIWILSHVHSFAQCINKKGDREETGRHGRQRSQGRWETGRLRRETREIKETDRQRTQRDRRHKETERKQGIER